MESKDRPCVQTVQDRQGRPLLVLVLHVQKHKPLHRSQLAGRVSGQKAEKTVETWLILFLFPLSFLLFPLSSPPKQICCLGRCFPVYWPLKHLEMHKHKPTHAHTNVVAPVLSEGDCKLQRELRTWWRVKSGWSSTSPSPPHAHTRTCEHSSVRLYAPRPGLSLRWCVSKQTCREAHSSLLHPTGCAKAAISKTSESNPIACFG